MVAAMASKSFVAQWMPVSISGEGEADDASALQSVVGAQHGVALQLQQRRNGSYDLTVVVHDKNFCLFHIRILPLLV